MNIKEELLKKCHQFVNNRLQNIEETISSNQTALQSETKSSAGDKHETGRAMLQLEMEKAGQQIANIQQMKETLAKIDVLKKSTNAHLGSLIKTNTGNYFLSVSVGQFKVDNELYFAVSVSSPIGKLLLGKSVNEQVMFNSKNIKLLSIK